MKVLVTGGAGFIGSHLVDKLIKKRHKVAVFDDLSGGKKENLNTNAVFIQGDCRNARQVEKAFKLFKPDIVFHLAADAAESKAQFSPITVTSRNYDAFIKVLTYSIKYGVKRFVFTSTIAVYGAQQTPFLEDSLPQPEDLYGVTKFAAEESLKIMSKVHELEFVIVRPHNVYGPRQNMNDPYRNVIMLWMNSILKNEPYYIYGDGEQTRCFSYIDDVIAGLYKCGFENVSGLTFNIGADKSYTLNKLSDFIQKTTKTNIVPIHLRDRPQEVKIAISSHKKGKKYLNYQDKTPLIIGIEKTWKWAKKQGFKKGNYEKLEIESRKTPENWRVKPKR